MLKKEKMWLIDFIKKIFESRKLKNMNITAQITGIKYNPKLTDDLTVFDFNNFNINLHIKTATTLLIRSNGHYPRLEVE